MAHHSIVAILACTVLIVLAAGCAAQSTGTASGLPDPAAAVPASEVSGTWRGAFWRVGAASTSWDGDVTLEIKDDATYRLVSTRRGTVNDSGVVVADGRGVTLKSSKGQWTRLTRKGDTLHGVAMSGSATINIMVERAP